ncbi:hypothetical protein HHUSO_G27502 [Huso huso]|uniref:Rab-GAP TBC domain-containing protein n=1 Tax=Huso huso TaxID=61971 RepID=A0ABR0YJZ4_HUSHU
MLKRRYSSTGSGGRASRRKNIFAGFDEFGFAIFKTKSREGTVQHRCHEYSYPKADDGKVKGLCELLNSWDDADDTCIVKVACFVRTGIPPELRGRVWKCLLGIHTLQESSPFIYQECLKGIRRQLVDLGVSEFGIGSAIATLSEAENEMESKKNTSQSAASSSEFSDVVLFRQIALDLQRSFPTHRSLMGDAPEAIEGQAKLFRVLIAYAIYNPWIGYSQGMSYIAAMLLMNLSEEEAFWALVALLEGPNYLAGLFDHSLDKIQHNAKVFQQLLKHRMPRLCQHIEDLGVTTLHFVTPWFLTLFTSLPCWDTVLAVWDHIILNGIVVVFTTGLCILQQLESRLLEMSDVSLLLPTLLRVPVDVSRHSVLVPALWRSEVHKWEIDCMQSLVLEEEGEEPVPGKGGKQGSLKRKKSKKEKRNLAGANGLDAKKPAQFTNRGTMGGATKNIFTKMLRVAQRYLQDPGQAVESCEIKQPPLNRSPIVRDHSMQISATSFSRGQIRGRKKLQSSYKEDKHRDRSQGLAATRSRQHSIQSPMDLMREIAGERCQGSVLKKRHSGAAKRQMVRRSSSQHSQGRVLRPHRDEQPFSPSKDRQAEGMRSQSRMAAAVCESNLEPAPFQARESSPGNRTLNKRESPLENTRESRLI